MKIYVCTGHANYGNMISSADGSAVGGCNEYNYNKELLPYIKKISSSLFFLLMNSHFVTSRAILFDFHLIWMLLLISIADVIFFATFCTFECYKLSRHF